MKSLKEQVMKKTWEIQLKKQEKLNELSAVRFKQFAASFNARFHKGVDKHDGAIEDSNYSRDKQIKEQHK